MSRERLAARILLGAMLGLIVTHPALASSGGGSLPWESPLQQIQQIGRAHV